MPNGRSEVEQLMIEDALKFLRVPTPPSVPTAGFEKWYSEEGAAGNREFSNRKSACWAAYKEGHDMGYREAIEEIACGRATPAAPETK